MYVGCWSYSSSYCSSELDITFDMTWDSHYQNVYSITGIQPVLQILEKSMVEINKEETGYWDSNTNLFLIVYYTALTSVKIKDMHLQLSAAVESFLMNFDVAPLVQLLLNSSLLSQKDHNNIVQFTESIFNTCFQVLKKN
ncbi:hypothetical protein RCL_jg10357.t1 [Rhizophagus clarus]|uniref:Uncharacterized protein n=1 Tax=Rhizophagus clarus TaxID=94130 RepID=A0A8H3KVN0_9GLOM|nr:hypothetical protein RCL_jg10357.t1 [Rhizophagus clarus]